MKTSTIPTLLGPDGMTSLREYAGYHGGGSGFGGQLRAWNPPGWQSLVILIISGLLPVHLHVARYFPPSFPLQVSFTVGDRANVR